MAEAVAVGPQSAEEYCERYFANDPRNQTGTIVRLPCYFCACPDFLVYRMRDSLKALSGGATCGECGRSARAKVTMAAANKWDFVIVQTGGDDPPEWLPGIPIERA